MKTFNLVLALFGTIYILANVKNFGSNPEENLGYLVLLVFAICNWLTWAKLNF